jgi:hypothetical protein
MNGRSDRGDQRRRADVVVRGRRHLVGTDEQLLPGRAALHEEEHGLAGVDRDPRTDEFGGASQLAQVAPGPDARSDARPQGACGVGLDFDPSSLDRLVGEPARWCREGARGDRVVRRFGSREHV